MKPNLEDMQVFVTVVEAQTFTIAAERLGRSKSAVSQTVSRLEKDLGERLFYRTTRSLSLTEVGANFYSHCCDIRDIYQSALADIKAKPTGTLTITAPHALCQSIVTPALNMFIRQYPELKVRLIADDVPKDLIESQIDLAIRVGSLEIQSAKVSKLGELSESLYASPDYITQQGGIPTELTEIVTWRHITSEWQGVPAKYQLPDGNTIRVTPSIRCNSLHDILYLANSGAGIARLPDICVTEQQHANTLCKIAELSVTPIHYMHLFDKQPPAKVKAFIELLRQSVQRAIPN